MKEAEWRKSLRRIIADVVFFLSGSVVPRKNRLEICPLCRGKLGSDKNPHTYENGIMDRERICENCGGIINSKQPPEEITGVRLPDGTQVWPPPFHVD